MTKEERKILEAVNKKLKQRGLPEMRRHPLFPMSRTFECKVSEMHTVIIDLPERRLRVFTRLRPGSSWGDSTIIGRFHGRGWLAGLTTATAAVVEAHLYLHSPEKLPGYDPAFGEQFERLLAVLTEHDVDLGEDSWPPQKRVAHIREAALLIEDALGPRSAGLAIGVYYCMRLGSEEDRAALCRRVGLWYPTKGST